MPFDMGFNCRGTAGYVTDAAYGVPVLGESYPHTYTNGNGDSVNAGWTSGPTGSLERGSSAFARVAGINYNSNNSSAATFQVDLSSGSNPGAGTYTVDLAFGEQGFTHLQDFKLLDTSTVLIDGTNGGSGYTTASDHFTDATLADVTVTPGNDWTGATVSKAFATTLAKLTCAFGTIGGGDHTTLAHFRLTLQEAAAVRRRPLMMLGVGS